MRGVPWTPCLPLLFKSSELEPNASGRQERMKYHERLHQLLTILCMCSHPLTTRQIVT